MSSNLGSGGFMEPLSIGNVVTAALRLYRSHFKQYLGLACQGLLWAMVPVYGWAKGHMLYGVIARMAYGELVNQPETVGMVKSQLRPRLWSFFLTQLLMGLTLFGVNFGIGIIQQILIVSIGLLAKDSPIVFGLVSLIIQLVGMVGYLWFYSRIFIPELPVGVEDMLDAGQAIARSWELTKGHVWRIQAIIVVASLITLPLMVIAMIPLFIAFTSFFVIFVPNINNVNSTPSEAAMATFFISLGIGIILILFASMLISPFWQAIKAVIYFDLRSRREGLGLKLRDYEV
ncbi:hypothetical protein [Calothrix sp. 336/3]|uniref:hypothetical protein n=1 Tax=Calothrix sp. 336/3 TaxID=1337936 RepID=UPI0004E376D0|nr:hypothetical protein [Calothrix sp. 336/3]AKG24338.1 hypothetical protein IJ00_26160 [Calothrix sp. 336/3]